VVTDAKQPKVAQGFVDGLAAGACADSLKRAGFGPAP
jgi:hypothetical protein